MGKKPAFGALKKAKPVAVEASAPAEAGSAKPAKRIQTSIRMPPEVWAAVNDLATRKRLETGGRVTVHDLLMDTVYRVLDENGIKLPR